MRNQVVKSHIKTHLKKMRQMLAATDNKAGQETISGEICNSYKLIDKAVSKGVMHKNKAARLKSRMTLASNKIART
jgi:small subunit ribosomal protein S20